jgi:hypothetical protein
VGGTPPPPSQVPSRRGGDLVPAETLTFPAIPGTGYTGWGRLPAAAYIAASLNPLFVQDFTVTPAANIANKRYVTLVSRIDADGNETGGIRLPLLQAPLGTYTGWALLKPGAGGPDLCNQSGQFIPFATTKAERLAAGDPRPSLEERYTGLDDFRAKLSAAIDAQVKARWMLREDAAAVLADGVDQYIHPRLRTAQDLSAH